MPTLVFTQNTPAEQAATGGLSPDQAPVGLGSYNFDSHTAQRVACSATTCPNSKPPPGTKAEAMWAWNEGDVEIPPAPYQIPLGIMLPRAAEARNLIVAGCVSASHVGLSTLRMEPQLMLMGAAAGELAALASWAQGDVHAVDVSMLQARLERAGQRVQR